MIVELFRAAFSQAVSGVQNATPENPAMSLQDPSTWDSLLEGTTADSGIRVSHTSSLSIAAVWQSASIISGDVASIPFDVFRQELDDAGSPARSTIDYNHAAEYLIATQPNQDTSAFEFWRRIMLHTLIWGNGYAHIVRDAPSAPPKQLINLLPDRTTPKYDDQGTLFYVTETINPSGVPVKVELKKSEVLHIKGLSIVPGLGLDLVAHARDAFGLSLAAEGFASKFFDNGVQAGGILELPASMTQKAKDNLEDGWSKRYTSKNNWFKTVILRDGAKFHSVTMSAQEAQMHELREDEIREVARFFNLPPFKLGLADSTSYNSTEQAQLVYLSGTLRHWLKALNSECVLKLLTAPQKRRRTHIFQHDVRTIIEVDAVSMNEILAIQRQNEVIDANEWRDKIGLNPRPEPEASELFNPNTKASLPSAEEEDEDTSTPEEPVVPDEEDDTEDRLQRISVLSKKMIENSMQRIVKRITSKATQLTQRKSNMANRQRDFQKWVNELSYAYKDVMQDSIATSVETYAQVEKCEEAHDVLTEELTTLVLDKVQTAFTEVTQSPYKLHELSDNVASTCDTFTSLAKTVIVSKLGNK